MYSDPGSGQQIRSRLRSDTSGLASESGGGSSSGVGTSHSVTSGNTTAVVSPSSRETLNSLDQFSQQRAAYSEGEWNADDTDAESSAGGGAAGANQDWDLRSTVAKLKKMSLRTFRLWR